MTKKISFEIENSTGSTIMAFEIDVTDVENPKVLQVRNCSHADTDGDYIFNTDNSLVRIQQD